LSYEPAAQRHRLALVLLSNGFTTLESEGGKYRIITAYQNRDDAWSDYKALCKAEQPAPVAPAPQCAPCNGRGSISDDDGIDMGLRNFCDGSGAKSAVVAMPEVLRNTIHKTLRHYRMGTLSDGEGGGYPLIDAMSADGQTVSGGIEECEYLADSIFSACIAEVARLNGVEP
jgi:hypothetical protein